MGKIKECDIDDCRGKVIARGWCNKHYRRFRRSGDPLKANRDLYASPEEAFEARTIPEPNTGCLLWTGVPDDGGYGIVSFRGGCLRQTWGRSRKAYT